MQNSHNAGLNRLRISAVARYDDGCGLPRLRVLIGCESQPSPDEALVNKLGGMES